MSAAGHTELQLPTNCYGIELPNGKPINSSKPGGKIDVPDEWMPAVEGSTAAHSGILPTNRGFSLGTRTGRWCAPCRFLAQAWSLECPKCGEPTVEESKRNDAIRT